MVWLYQLKLVLEFVANYFQNSLLEKGENSLGKCKILGSF